MKDLYGYLNEYVSTHQFSNRKFNFNRLRTQIFVIGCLMTLMCFFNVNSSAQNRKQINAASGGVNQMSDFSGNRRETSKIMSGSDRSIERRANPNNHAKPANSGDSPNAVACGPTGITRTVPGDFTTIQGAIDASSTTNRDTIQVAAGTYTEQLVINKCVNIVGNGQTGANGTFVQAPATLAVNTAVNAASIVEVNNNATVTISNLTVTGPVVFPGGANDPAVYGVYVIGNALLQMTDATVTKIRKEPLDGSQNGFAVRAGSFGFNQVGELDFTRVTVSDYQKSGVIVSNTGSNASFKDGLVAGAGAQAAIAQNGFEIFDGATATITNNTIRDLLCNNPTCGPDPINDVQSYAFLLAANNVVTISGNTITNNDGGYINFEGAAGVQNQIIGNTFTSRYIGVFLGQGSTLVQNNFISGGNQGAVVASFGGETGNAVGDFQNNSITGAAQSGIQLLDADTTDTFVPQVNANFNRIAGNGGANLIGIDNQTTSPVTAENNFWGCNAGPNGGAGCDQVVGNVTANPYLILSRTTASPTSVGGGGTSTITANLRFNNAGTDTFTAANHLPNPIPATASSANSPNGIPVTFTATNGTVNPTVTPLVDGLASTTFTGGTVSGSQTATITARVDNATDSVNVTVLGPTAAGVSIQGRVLNPAMTGIANARLTLTDSSGQSRTTTSNSFGYFIFADIPAGQTYVLQVNARRYGFMPLVLPLSDNLVNFNIIAVNK